MPIRTLIAAAAAAALLGTSAPPADAAVDRTLFNDPHLAPYSKTQELRTLIDGTPKGETIRGSIYTLNLRWVREALQRADARGVNVQLVAREQARNSELRALETAFATDAKGQSSWLVYCRASCGRGGSIGTQHAKAFTFTATGDSTHVSYLSSNNVSVGGSEGSWGTAQVIHDNACVHDPLAAFLDEMRHDTVMKQAKPIRCGRYSLYLVGKVIADHPVYTLLKNTSGRTPCEVYLPMFIWRDEELRTAQRLGELRKAGCTVEVIIDQPTTSKRVQDALKRYRVPTWNGRTSVTYVHNKGLTILGHVNGTRTALSVGGSANLTKSAQGWDGKAARNTDLVLIDRNAETAKAHKATFQHMKTGLVRLW